MKDGMTDAEFQQEATQLRARLISVAVRYLKSEEPAEDIVQDTMLRLWQLRLELHQPLMPLASVLTRNLSIDYLRRQRPCQSLADVQLASEEEKGSVERYNRMMSILDNLPGLQQTLLRLRHIEGMEYGDIARIMGSSEVAVRQAISRARRKILKKYEDENGRNKNID
ncbi:RNA polymerase sigma factor [Prevotella rectalis]|uniref:RNA polymerase sigma factor n=1 Tax=Prevotella rectalis TaxID=2219999 RepID=UPI0021041FCD|nr:sigma-70 family RNA polymerase sigma factor [Prevotella brunnea]